MAYARFNPCSPCCCCIIGRFTFRVPLVANFPAPTIYKNMDGTIIFIEDQDGHEVVSCIMDDTGTCALVLPNKDTYVVKGAIEGENYTLFSPFNTVCGINTVNLSASSITVVVKACNGIVLEDADVTLTKGDKTMTSTTNKDGEAFFVAAENGTYNISVSETSDLFKAYSGTAANLFSASIITHNAQLVPMNDYRCINWGDSWDFTYPLPTALNLHDSVYGDIPLMWSDSIPTPNNESVFISGWHAEKTVNFAGYGTCDPGSVPIRYILLPSTSTPLQIWYRTGTSFGGITCPTTGVNDALTSQMPVITDLTTTVGEFSASFAKPLPYTSTGIYPTRPTWVVTQ